MCDRHASRRDDRRRSRFESSHASPARAPGANHPPSCARLRHRRSLRSRDRTPQSSRRIPPGDGSSACRPSTSLSHCGRSFVGRRLACAGSRSVDRAPPHRREGWCQRLSDRVCLDRGKGPSRSADGASRGALSRIRLGDECRLSGGGARGGAHATRSDAAPPPFIRARERRGARARRQAAPLRSAGRRNRRSRDRARPTPAPPAPPPGLRDSCGCAHRAANPRSECPA